jgi:hypothetical protein
VGAVLYLRLVPRFNLKDQSSASSSAAVRTGHTERFALRGRRVKVGQPLDRSINIMQRRLGIDPDGQ